MKNQEHKSLKSLGEILNTPDFRNVKSVYLNIKVNAFIEYFKRLTKREKYYDEVFATLVEISKEVFNNSTDEKIRENLTMCGLFFAAELLLKQDGDNANQVLFILDKALIEPIAVCGNIERDVPETENNSDLRKEVFF